MRWKEYIVFHDLVLNGYNKNDDILIHSKLSNANMTQKCSII